MRFAPALIDLLLTRGPLRADDIANLLLTGDRQRARCCRRNSATKRVALRYLRSCSWWYRIGGKADTLGWRDKACGPYRFIVRGRWDRNRTCNLRFWSLLPFVQQRSGKYTNRLEMAHFDGPKYVEVHQRSPALGSTLGSSRGKWVFFYRLGGDSGSRSLSGSAGLRAPLGRARNRRTFLASGPA